MGKTETHWMINMADTFLSQGGKKVNTTCSNRDTSRQGSWMPQMYHDGKGTSSLLGDSSPKSTSPVSS